jgi:hypothetical protein
MHIPCPIIYHKKKKIANFACPGVLVIKIFMDSIAPIGSLIEKAKQLVYNGKMKAVI